MCWIYLPNNVQIPNGIEEPIFRADTVRPGVPLIISEGITDCISAHQASISPGTVQFKEDQKPPWLISAVLPAGFTSSLTMRTTIPASAGRLLRVKT